MYKKIKIVAGLAVMTTLLFASEIAGITKPKEWKVFYSRDITFENASSIRYEDDSLSLIPGKEPVSPVIMEVGEKLDLAKERKYTPKVDVAAIVGCLQSDAPRTIYIGMGADWWLDAFCNGKHIGGTDSWGNDNWPPTPQDHIFKLDLRQGRNEIVLRTRPGLGSWIVAVDFFAECDDPDAVPRHLPAPRVAFGPYLTNPDSTSVTITYLLEGRQPMELEFRKQGESEWTRVANLCAGQIIDETPIQHFNLDNLEEDTVYEYRALLRQPPDYWESIPDKTHTFRTYSESPRDFSFFIMSDTHDSQKRSELARLRKLFAARPELLKSDFLMHLGDLHGSGYIDNFRSDVFDCMFKLIPPEVYLMSIRGNHEFEGCENQQWLDHFAYKDGKSYGIFRIGEVCILMLDTGYHRELHPENSALNRLDTLLEEEKIWLEEVVKTPQFTTAKYRIVMAHVAPTQNDGFNHMVPRTKYMVNEVFRGNPAPYPIDLWISGHIHKYSNRAADNEWNFPVVTLSSAGEGKENPGMSLYFQVTDGKITMTALNGDGSTHDTMTLPAKTEKR